VSGTDYFIFANLQAGTTARASDVNSRMAAIQGGFAKLPAPEQIQQDRMTAVVDTGAANALVANLDFAPASYTFGLSLTVKVGVTNTSSATINVNGLGIKSIRRGDGSNLQAGDLIAGRIVRMVYDGSNFQLVGASETAVAASAAAAAASAAAAAASATAAAGSATAAATSAVNAATSEANAAASAAAAGNKVAKAGDTMTGALTLFGAPTSNLHAATKKYVDDAVFAAGAYTADGASITLSGGQFSLTTIANNRLFGNVSGGVAKPGALTGTQATALLDVFTAGAKGLVPVGGAANKVLRDDGTWTNDIPGNAATATKLATARTIAISGAVTGNATSFDGSGNITIPISAMDVGAATTGTLPVARGGTGVTTSTGTGSVVLSISPTFTGTVNGADLALTGNFALLTNNRAIYWKDANGSTPSMICQNDNNFVFYGSGAAGGARPIWSVVQRSDTSVFALAVTATGIAPVAGDNSIKIPTTAWVQTELTGKAPAKLSLTLNWSFDFTLDNVHNNALVSLIGSHTITANSTPDAGVSVLLVNLGGSWTFSCAGGVYLAGSTATVTSANIPAGAHCTAIHLGGGVWVLDGV
jgi:hypothetical protein